MNLYSFLEEYAKFAFPDPIEDKTASSTDIKYTEVGQLDKKWKATQAVRDDGLPDKLCRALKHTLRTSNITDAMQKHLLTYFSPLVERDLGVIKSDWEQNPDELTVAFLLLTTYFR